MSKEQLVFIVSTLSTSHLNFKNRNIRSLEKFIMNNTSFLPLDVKASERIYCIIHDIKSIPKCEYCGDTNVKFLNYTLGYRRYCSQKCSASSPSTRETYKNTCIEKYGVDNVQKHEIFQEKTKATKLCIYGNEYYTNPEKSRVTRMERYGDPGYTNRNKSMATCMKRYGKPYYMTFGSDEWKNLMFANHGTYYPSQKRFFNLHGCFIDNNHNKTKITNFTKFGCPEILASEYFRNMMFETGRYKSMEELNDYYLYKRTVLKYTKLSYIPDPNKTRGYKTYHLDHKVSIFHGFKNNVPPYIIGSSVNLELIYWKDNIIKNFNSSMSLEYLFRKYFIP